MSMTRQYIFRCDHEGCASSISFEINPAHMSDADWLVAQSALPPRGWRLAVSRTLPSKQLHYCHLHAYKAAC